MQRNYQSNQIKASVIAASYNPFTNATAWTFELEYPRFIHSEFMTHRMLSKNSASSRAIPVEKMLEQVRNDPAMPCYWGLNQSGMQSAEEPSEDVKQELIQQWKQAANSAADSVENLLAVANLHKQTVNRLLEPFQIIKVVCTGTEWNNFFALRMHQDAQPEIHLLAQKMHQSMQGFTPKILNEGEWHLPYVPEDFEGTEKDALILSTSLCAQVSYRKSDDSLDKARIIWKRLIESKPVHASPTEHQLQCFKSWHWPKGITHEDNRGSLWSGNIRGFVQHRQLLDGHAVKG